jgi:probable H4MPT-linked C1 transfer pathway protein
MTGELADGFASKANGVRAIVAAAVEAAAGRPVHFWQTGGEFLGPEDAAELPRFVAAANWHALATFCGRVVPHGPALLIDVGSTTTDIIPLRDGRVAAEGLTDPERLRVGELVYTGATRTPVCALGPSVSIGGESYPLAAEFFATMKDVSLLLGDLTEDSTDRDTADGRPATVEFATPRLARMLCADPEEVGEETVHRLAESLRDRQQELVAAALDRVLDRLGGRPQVLLSGSGIFVAEQVVARCPRLAGAEVTSLAELFARRVSRSACAYAVARLAAERLSI